MYKSIPVPLTSVGTDSVVTKPKRILSSLASIHLPRVAENRSLIVVEALNGLPIIIGVTVAESSSAKKVEDFLNTQIKEKVEECARELTDQPYQADRVKERIQKLADDINSLIQTQTPGEFDLAIAITFQDDQKDLHLAGFGIGDSALVLETSQHGFSTIKPSQTLVKPEQTTPGTGEEFSPFIFDVQILRGEQVYFLTEGAFKLLPTHLEKSKQGDHTLTTRDLKPQEDYLVGAMLTDFRKIDLENEHAIAQFWVSYSLRESEFNEILQRGEYQDLVKEYEDTTTDKALAKINLADKLLHRIKEQQHDLFIVIPPNFASKEEWLGHEDFRKRIGQLNEAERMVAGYLGYLRMEPSKMIQYRKELDSLCRQYQIQEDNLADKVNELWYKTEKEISKVKGQKYHASISILGGIDLASVRVQIPSETEQQLIIMQIFFPFLQKAIDKAIAEYEPKGRLGGIYILKGEGHMRAKFFQASFEAAIQKEESWLSVKTLLLKHFGRTETISFGPFKFEHPGRLGNDSFDAILMKHLKNDEFLNKYFGLAKYDLNDIEQRTSARDHIVTLLTPTTKPAPVVAPATSPGPQNNG